MSVFRCVCVCSGVCLSINSSEVGMQACSVGDVDPSSHFLVEVLCEVRDWKQSCQGACFRAVRVGSLHLGLTLLLESGKDISLSSRFFTF